MGVSEHFELTGRIGEPITLPIAAGPATGHDWMLELPPGLERIEDAPPCAVDASAALGGASGGLLQVRAAAAGDYLVVARLARPWQKDRPVRLVSVQLHVT